ncbi:unnamed protein product [Candidula unifasciata]|uniref:YDG domain-containing protein n=1 Tax=Candidula unifasciata TaxID=100452 RepID=A0A8S3ZBJ4_9EUPU|nr:unnamed protein product [Candidula unifasciata]
MCDYEIIRLRNLEDNRRVLASFGLLDPFKSLPRIIKQNKKPVLKSTNLKRKLPVTDCDFIGGSLYGTRRKSARLEQSSDNRVSYEELGACSDEKQVTKVPSNRPHFYGAVSGIDVGTVWATRMECCRDGIHRPTVAGIHGGEDGAYSIALSGGYEDDIDLGDCFTYTGEGGRDLKGTKSNPKNLRTAPQSRDQTLTRGNLALSKNVETKNPVRVIRGYKLQSPFAPEEGYRYDGLYTVEKCWFVTGLSGFGVWKFALRRCPNQDPSPWQFSDSTSLTHLHKFDVSCTHPIDKEPDHNDGSANTVAEDDTDASSKTGVEAVNCKVTQALDDKGNSVDETRSKGVLQEISVVRASAVTRKRGRNKKVNGSF